MKDQMFLAEYFLIHNELKGKRGYLKKCKICIHI